MAIPKFRETLAFLLGQSGAVAFERFDGTIAPVTLDDPGSTSRTLVDGEIITDAKGLFRITPNYTSMKNLITRIDVRYKKIHPLDDEYGAVKFCRRIDDTLATNEQRHNFTSSGNKYSGFLQTAYDYTNEDNPLTILADGIRDDATAEALAKLIITFRFKPLVILNAVCKYSVLDIEIADKIASNLTFIKSLWNNYTWLAIGQGIIPNVKSKPGVNLILLELGSATASLPTVLVWQDGGVGDFKQDGAVGNFYVEV